MLRLLIHFDYRLFVGWSLPLVRVCRRATLSRQGCLHIRLENMFDQLFSLTQYSRSQALDRMILGLLKSLLRLLRGVSWPRHHRLFLTSCFASSGHADGIGALARCFYSGRGVPKDDTMALSLASSSADSGSAYGQYVLGAMHFNGDCGFAANDAKAAELWHLAAEQGHIASADWLSVLCASSFLILCILLSHPSFIQHVLRRLGRRARSSPGLLFFSSDVFILITAYRRKRGILSQCLQGLLELNCFLNRSARALERHLPHPDFQICKSNTGAGRTSRACNCANCVRNIIKITKKTFTTSHKNNGKLFQMAPLAPVQTDLCGH